MVKDLTKIVELKETLDDFLHAYELRKSLFSQMPKYDIPQLFALWDEYLTFLDTHVEAEKSERERRAKERNGRELPLIHIDGGYAQKITSSATIIYDKISNLLNQIFVGTETSRIAHLAAQGTGDHNLFAFFIHDINHILCDLTRQHWSAGLPKYDSSVRRMRHRREEVQQLLELFNQDPEFLYGTYLEPYKMLDFIATEELKLKQRYVVFNPGDLALKTAHILQNRFPQFEYSLVDRLTDTPANEIAVDAEPTAMYGNSGVMFSIIYNLAKNSYKKMAERTKGKDDTPLTNAKIFIHVYEAPLSSVVLTVGDNGAPINLDQMKDKIRQLILEKGIEQVVFPHAKAKERYHSWQRSEYKVGDLTMRDITDVAYMARMSGFDNNDQMSSGLGLYGLKYFVEKMGGIILYGESFETGSPIFTCVLPKRMSTGGVRKRLSLLASAYNAHRLYQEGYNHNR